MRPMRMKLEDDHVITEQPALVIDYVELQK